MLKRLRDRFSKERASQHEAGAETAAAQTSDTPPEPNGAGQPAVASVTIDNRRYRLADLSEEVRQLLMGLRTAEQLIEIHRDKLRVLTLGRQALGLRLKEGLAAAKPLPAAEQVAEEPPTTWHAQLSAEPRG